MKVVIEFHRIRASDGARAKVGRLKCDVIGTEAAIELAESLLSSLAMPQEPDAVTISDNQGNAFYRAAVRSGHVPERDRDALEISVWENEGGAVAARHTAVGQQRRSENFSLLSNGNEVSEHDTHFSQ
ncbi:hypothetical protein [Mesorhizobium xinjiangense]|uniref:hypothetical protein n=1 Tax=Mesorhizobium xinjiangense TaxID=2678685 RepID=UPI0012ED6D43|nr:hypothetical protein [Mesorhizobium xinjiangense]